MRSVKSTRPVSLLDVLATLEPLDEGCAIFVGGVASVPRTPGGRAPEEAMSPECDR